MLNPLHADASTNAETDFLLSFQHTLSSRIAPPDNDSASAGRPDNEYLFDFDGTGEQPENAGLLHGSVSNSHASIEYLPWVDGHEDVTSFHNTWSLDHLSLDTSLPDPPPASSDWQYEFGTSHQSTLNELDYPPTPQRSYTSPIWMGYEDTKISDLPYESISSACSVDLATPSSPQSFAPVYESDRSRRDSSSSRMSRSTSQMSRTTSQMSSLSSASEPYKRRINPLKQSKTALRDPADSFFCDTCKRPFRYKKDLERHRFSIHDRRPSWFCPDTDCRFATQGFSRKDKAFQHVKTHRSNSDAGLEPIFSTERASLRSIGSAPVSPHIPSGYHRFPTPLREREEQDTDTLN